MNCIRSRSNKCPHRTGGKRELSSKLGNAARRDCKTRESESRYSRCAGCTNLIWTVSGIRGFHAFWIQLLPTASLLHPLWWLWPVNNGHRHLTRRNCPRLTWKSRGVKRKKEMTNRQKRFYSSLSTGCKIRVFHPSLLHFYRSQSSVSELVIFSLSHSKPSLKQAVDILTPPGLFTAEFTSLFIE